VYVVSLFLDCIDSENGGSRQSHTFRPTPADSVSAVPGDLNRVEKCGKNLKFQKQKWNIYHAGGMRIIRVYDICMYICVYTYMFVCVYVCIYIYNFSKYKWTEKPLVKCRRDWDCNIKIHFQNIRYEDLLSNFTV
jgi:hypothetical protein